jgi:hypothetical protein
MHDAQLADERTRYTRHVLTINYFIVHFVLFPPNAMDPTGQIRLYEFLMACLDMMLDYIGPFHWQNFGNKLSTYFCN